VGRARVLGAWSKGDKPRVITLGPVEDVEQSDFDAGDGGVSTQP
jgi:hypothetical protein